MDHCALGSTRTKGASRILLSAAIIASVFLDPCRLHAAQAPSDTDIEAAFDAADLEGTDDSSSAEGLYEATVVDTPLSATERSTAFAETIEVADKTAEVSSVADVLSRAAGVQVRQLGGLGSMATASIRGSTASQVLVFLDGVPLNVGGFSAVNLGDLSLDVLESMEVYRGYTPLSLGMGGIGGAVVLRTRSLGEPQTELALSGGSWATGRLLLLRGDRIGRVDALAIVSASGSKGDFEYFNRNGTPFNEEDDELVPRRNNEHGAISSMVKGSAELGVFRLTILNDTLVKHQGIAGLDSVPTRSAQARTMRELIGLSLEPEKDAKRHARWSLGASYLLTQQDFDDTENEIGVGRQRTVSRSDSMTAHGLLELRLAEAHLASVYLEPTYDRFETRDLMGGDAPRPSYRGKVGAGLAYDYTPAPWLTLGPVVRGQWHHVYWPGGAQAGALTTNDTREGDMFYWSPSLGAKSEPLPWLVLRANVGRYVRPPDLFELYGDNGAIVGNPELEAEQGTNADTGFTLHGRNLGLVDAVRFDAAGFVSWAQNLIAYTQNSQHTLRLENVDNARILGIETSMSLSAWRYYTLTANYTFTDGINRSDKPYHNGKVLPGRPRHEALLHVEADRDFRNLGSGAWLELDYAGRSFLDQANLKEDTLGRTLLGAGTKLRLPRAQLTLTLEVHNILDTIVLEDDQGHSRPLRDYESFPLPGRTFYATVRWKP